MNGSRVRDVVEIAVRTILEVVQDRQGLARAFLAHGATDRALAAGLRRIGAHMTSRSGVRFTREELAEETSRVISAYLADRVPS